MAVATWHNPRWDALPCERMRGCSFAEEFLTLERMEQNAATITGATTADHGVVFDGTGTAEYVIVPQPGKFSVVIRFSTSIETIGTLLANAALIPGAAIDGFCVWVDSTGIRANHSNGVAIPTRCSVDIDYADGEEHTITYVVDMTGGAHHLYVDALDVDTQTTTINETIGEANAVYSGTMFTGTIYKARIFDATLSEGDHDVYSAGTLEALMETPWAAYRCDAFNDDTDGAYIWDRTIAQRDLEQADRVTSSQFVTLVLLPTPHYVFDGVDDYIINPNELPAAFTMTLAQSSSGYVGGTDYPLVVQVNDETLIDAAETPGGIAGNLHALVIHDKVLTPVELLCDEYAHMYWLYRGRAFGAVQRLIAEGVGVFSEFLDYPAYPWTDYAGDVVGVPTLITGGGEDGALFASATSNVEYPDAALLECVDVTILVLGTFAGSEAAGTIVDKGTNYKLLTNGNQIDFNGSTIAHTFADNESIAVVCKSGEKPMFYVDGVYIGEGTTAETPDDSDATVLNIGNNNEKNSPTAYPIKQVHIFNEALTGV